ncbi:hypothetical protein [Lactococcus cremoris]|uniref:Uncharacterized protein n=1 Tax=Lactococcus lactis subsp. cremoris TaxID=1359 RepID=A0AAF0P3H9_LACLC|nr:hypothetical protein [Lactococcus cremoris]WMF94449.1 hypothetical protein LLJM1_04510 [Lactococcus cremoris]
MTQYLAILISDFTTNTINEIIMSKRAIGKIELIFKKATWYLRGRIELLIIPKTSTITPLTNILKVVLFDVWLILRIISTPMTSATIPVSER